MNRLTESALSFAQVRNVAENLYLRTGVLSRLLEERDDVRDDEVNPEDASEDEDLGEAQAPDKPRQEALRQHSSLR